MKIKANQFYNPAESPFEVLGFFEEYIEAGVTGDWPKLLGVRVLKVDEAPRALGSDGRVLQTLIAPIELKRGHKTVTVNASLRKPVGVFVMVQPLCGKTKERPAMSSADHNRFPKGRW